MVKQPPAVRRCRLGSVKAHFGDWLCRAGISAILVVSAATTAVAVGTFLLIEAITSLMF